VNELRAKFSEAKYILDEDAIRQVYLAGVMQKPILIEGPPGPIRDSCFWRYI
jgi:MoxR-like ATPase